MIIILKHGNRQICSCKVCGCEFSYEEIDVNLKSKRLKVITCPQCKYMITLNGEPIDDEHEERNDDN